MELVHEGRPELVKLVNEMLATPLCKQVCKEYDRLLAIIHDVEDDAIVALVLIAFANRMKAMGERPW